MIKMEFEDQDARYLRVILLQYSAIIPGREAGIALRLYGDVDYFIKQSGEE